nr:hypothetical protein [Tanacetum cinerariifolium]
MATNEEKSAAGSDTRPPMLVESDYDSWKICIHMYIRGKPHGKLIWKSIQDGPSPHPMITDPQPKGSTVVPMPRKKLDSEFSDEENTREMADTQAEIILTTMTQIANLLSGFHKQFPPTNNQLRTSSNSKTHATVHDGQNVTEPAQRKAPGNVGNNGARANHEDAYDLDVDEGSNANVTFMANLTSKDINEVHFDDNHIFDNVNHQLAQEM